MELNAVRCLVVLGIALSLGGCVTMQQAGTALGGVAGGALGKFLPAQIDRKYKILAGTALGAFIGNQIGRYLDEQDRKKMLVTTQQAFDTGTTQSWWSDDKQTRGSAKVVASRTEKTNVAVPVLKSKVSQVPPLDIVGMTYKAKAVSAIHGGPGTDYQKVGSLRADEAVTVVGKVKGSEWFLISQDGAGSGFVLSSLMQEAPDDVPATTGTAASADVVTQTVASERVCRTVEQSVSLADGSAKTEKVEACKGPKGWEPKAA